MGRSGSASGAGRRGSKVTDKPISLDAERAKRRSPATRFVLLATDAGPNAVAWEWWIEDLDTAQYRPSKPMIATQLRRIADRYDPRPRFKGRKGRR